MIAQNNSFKKNSTNKIPRLGFFPSLCIFVLASCVLILETRYIIPFLSSITGWEPVLFWFLVAGLGMFLPLLVIAFIAVKKESYTFDAVLWTERLRFRNLNASDWLWSFGALVVIGILGAVIMELIKIFGGDVSAQPSFMTFEPLTAGRYWLLLVWFPYWLLNIMGEEILWRGVLLPRQERVFGKYTWLMHGFFWGIFHIAFGWNLLLTLVPVLFIEPYVVQRRKNSWIGVIIHAGINGPSFLAISFGLI